MSSKPSAIPEFDHEADFVIMPTPTVAPLVLALGLALLAVGALVGPAFLVVGGLVFVVGLGRWITQLLPGQGHFHEEFVPPALRARPVAARIGAVERMRSGLPGYRLRLPAEFHPISAGIRGGIVGGIVMTVPALAYGVLSGHGLWYPSNLLAGMLLPGVDQMTTEGLEQFRPSLLLVAIVIHATNSIVFGMIYGVLLPTLPDLPRPLAWGGLMIPILWTAVSFGLMGVVNPVLRNGVDWPWFIASQFLFGVVAALTVMWASKLPPIRSGLLAGTVAGLLMPIPALIWGLSSGHGLWYPANLLAGMVLPKLGRIPTPALEQFDADWLAIAVVIHIVMSLGIGLVFGLTLPKLGPIPSALTWGGILMPLLWTAVSFGLMGIVNPLLQQRVNWPWFVVSQFVFGVVAAVVVDRSESYYIPPAGRGRDESKSVVDGLKKVQS